MIGFVRELRLIPIVLMASACLLVLKTVGLLLDGGYIIAGDDAGKGDDRSPDRLGSRRTCRNVSSRQSWAQEMFNFPDVTGSVRPSSVMPRPAERSNPDITGSVQPKPAEHGRKAGDRAPRPTRSRPPPRMPRTASLRPVR